MRAGVTCYLGVNVEGALFSIGDGHCRQGEGETCGVAVEAAMDTVIVVDLIKGRATPWPRLESDTHVMSTGSARPLEDAFRIAHADLIAWMGEEYGLDALDAYQLVTQVSESPVANVVRPELHVPREDRQVLSPSGRRLRRHTREAAGGGPLVSGGPVNIVQVLFDGEPVPAVASGCVDSDSSLIEGWAAEVWTDAAAARR